MIFHIYFEKKTNVSFLALPRHRSQHQEERRSVQAATQGDQGQKGEEILFVIVEDFLQHLLHKRERVHISNKYLHD